MDRERLQHALRNAVSDAGGPADAMQTAAALVSTLPGDLLAALHQYTNHGNAHQTLLVGGLFETDDDLPGTPETLLRKQSDASVLTRELCLLTVAKILGEPFTFADLYGGRLVQDVAPVRELEHTQTSGGSGTPLTWHVEDAHTAERCDYFGLLALRGDTSASTWVCAASSIKLSPATEAVLRQPRFLIESDQAHTESHTPQPVCVLTGGATDLRIRYDSVYMRPVDRLAAKALDELRDAISCAYIGHVLQPGELLIVDNRRAVHARTEFAARYDGRDRWLLRTMICASQRHHRRRGSKRQISIG